MPLMYKLVSQEFTTHSNTKWISGKQVIAGNPGGGNTMCTNQVLHCYQNKYIAMIINSKHANISNPRLIQVSCSAIVANDGLKFACKKQTMLRELKIPSISTEQKVHFAILCALEVYDAPAFVAWANNWISGVDRSIDAAAYATAAANAAYAAANAADAAAYAAYAAAAAAYAAYAAAAAANAAAAAAAANAAKYKNKKINFSTLINQAMQKS